MENTVHQLFYVSRATRAFDSEAIQSILETSRRNNPARGVTGCLLFSGTHFAQVVEGGAQVIASLVEHIASDPRHEGLRLLVECVKPAAEYADWSMGYLHDLELEDDLSQLLLEPNASAHVLTDVMARMRPHASFGALFPASATASPRSSDPRDAARPHTPVTLR